MAKLIIKRSSEYMNILRAIGIYLDGKKIGVISSGQTKEFDIDPGNHELKTRIDWCSSEPVTFNVAERDVQEVKLSGFKYGIWYVPIAFVSLISIMVFAKDMGESVWIFEIVLFLIGFPLLYFLTVGSNRYLRLQKR